MKAPKVSVLIPSYNRGYCIADCIRSVQMQDYPNLEIIVIDDASTDDTRERIAAIDEPRLRYVVHDRNRGGAVARNTGIRHASGDYIAFLDSDDRWLPGKLEKQINGLLAQGRDYGFSYTWLRCVDADEREVMRIDPEYEGDCRQQILISNFIGTFSNVVIRRDLFSLAGWLDEEMRSCQDWELFIRLLRITRVHCLREYLVDYRHSSGDAVRISLNPTSVVQGHRRILRKFASDYRALPRARRREALMIFFNVFANVGALAETCKTGLAILFAHGPGELHRLARGMARAGRRSMLRLRRRYGVAC